MAYILRYQPADFGANVFDSEQLSAVRGASLTYLYSSKLVDKVIDRELPDGNYEKVYAGGSHGVWILECSKEEAVKVAGRVREALDRDDLGSANATGPHSQVAYVMALVEGDDEAALKRAEAVNAGQKLQQAAWIAPQFDATARGFDKFDRSRPATITAFPLPGGAREDVSPNFAARFRFGRKQRHQFYERMLGSDYGSFRVTRDLQTMVADPPGGIPASLGNKVGVFFADANRLNRIRQEHADADLDELGKFSRHLLGKQTFLLKTIVDWFAEGGLNKATAERFGQATDDDPEETDPFLHRLETLMWGGDELLIVVPSWLALEFAARFFEAVKGWRAPNGKPITFSAGLLVCDRKTPIRLAKSIADKLAALGKHAQPSETIGLRNVLQIEVFESLSLPEADFERFRSRLYAGEYAARETQTERENSRPATCDRRRGYRRSDRSHRQAQDRRQRLAEIAALQAAAVDHCERRGAHARR